MFEKNQKPVQAMLNPAAFNERLSNALIHGQARLSKMSSDARELSAIEIEHLTQLAQSRRPEDFIAASKAAFAKRQAFFTSQWSAFNESAKLAREQWSQAARSKASEASAQAHQAASAALESAKQGLDLALDAVKAAAPSVKR